MSSPHLGLVILPILAVGVVAPKPRGVTAWRPWGLLGVLTLVGISSANKLITLGLDTSLLVGLITLLVGHVMPVRWRPVLGILGMVSALPLLPTIVTQTPAAPFWVMALAAIVALGLEANRDDLGAWSYAAGAAGVALADSLSRFGNDGNVTQVGIFLCGSAGLAILLSFACGDKFGKWIGALAFGLLGFYAIFTTQKHIEVAYLLPGGVIFGLVCYWMVPDGTLSPSRWGVLATIWVGAATLAFTFGFGLGMAILLTGGLYVAIAFQSSQLVWGAAPLFALTVSRVIREGQISAIKAFDIGQHYALLGLVVGLVVCLAAADWISNLTESRTLKSHLAIVAAIFLSWGLILFASVFLGAKGYVGLMIGGAISPFVAGLAKSHSRTITPLAIGSVGILGLSYSSLSQFFDIGRGQKQIAFYIVFVIAILLAGFAALMSRSLTQDVPS